MNHLSKYRENNRLITNYIAYLDECTEYGDRLKLCAEIGRLQNQNERIEKMPYQDTRNDIYDWTIQTNALL